MGPVITIPSFDPLGAAVCFRELAEHPKLLNDAERARDACEQSRALLDWVTAVRAVVCAMSAGLTQLGGSGKVSFVSRSVVEAADVLSDPPTLAGHNDRKRVSARERQRRSRALQKLKNGTCDKRDSGASASVTGVTETVPERDMSHRESVTTEPLGGVTACDTRDQNDVTSVTSVAAGPLNSDQTLTLLPTEAEESESLEEKKIGSVRENADVTGSVTERDSHTASHVTSVTAGCDGPSVTECDSAGVTASVTGVTEHDARDVGLVLVSANAPTNGNGKTKANAGERGWRVFPKDYAPDAEDRAYAASLRLDFDAQFEELLDYDFPKPRLRPPAVLRRWLRTAREMADTRATTNGYAGKPRQSPIPAKSLANFDATDSDDDIHVDESEIDISLRSVN